MGNTANRNYPLPVATNDVSADVAVLIAAFTAIDADIGAALLSIAGKAAAGHSHAITAITGLTEALAALAPLNHTHALGGLSDVNATGIAIDYLIKWSGTGWVPVSAAAALGAHGHTIAQITDLATTLAAKLAKDQNLADLPDIAVARTNLGLGTMAQINVVTATVAPDPATLAENTIVLIVDP